MAILGENMDFDGLEHKSFKHRSGSIQSVQINWEEPLKTEIEHFAQCIMGNISCRSDVNHAKKVIKILQLGSCI